MIYWWILSPTQLISLHHTPSTHYRSSNTICKTSLILLFRCKHNNTATTSVVISSWCGCKHKTNKKQRKITQQKDWRQYQENKSTHVKLIIFDCCCWSTIIPAFINMGYSMLVGLVGELIMNPSVQVCVAYFNKLPHKLHGHKRKQSH